VSVVTVSYKFDEIVGAVNAVMPHASKDDVTPVMTGIRFTADGSIVATDRYTVGAYTFNRCDVTADPDSGFDGFTLGKAGVLWLSKLKPATLALGKYSTQFYTVQFTVEALMVKVDIVQNGFGGDSQEGDFVDSGVVEASSTFPLVGGNYPPVMRLMPDDARLAAEEGIGSTPISLKTEFLMRIDKATKALSERGNGTAKFRFLSTENPAKPGPVFVTVGDNFKALIQPNLLLNR